MCVPSVFPTLIYLHRPTTISTSIAMYWLFFSFLFLFLLLWISNLISLFSCECVCWGWARWPITICNPPRTFVWAKISYPSAELSLAFFWYFVFCKSLLLGVPEILSALNYLFSYHFTAFILTVLSEGEEAWAWDIKGVWEKWGGGGWGWRMTPVLGAAQVVRRRWAVGIAVWSRSRCEITLL